MRVDGIDGSVAPLGIACSACGPFWALSRQGATHCWDATAMLLANHRSDHRGLPERCWVATGPMRALLLASTTCASTEHTTCAWFSRYLELTTPLPLMRYMQTTGGVLE